jgi:aldehyde:ferredoxin oxidoreductase
MINDLEKIAHLDRLCDDIGIDTIETGACLGLFMEAGKINWGDGDACIELVKGIYKNNPESMWLGLGVYELGKKLNVNRVPHVKRQSFPSYMPRALKAPAITFLTGPMGADHTAGDISGNNAADPEGKLELSKGKQISTMIVDSMGICYFVGLTLEKMDEVGKLLTSRYGPEWHLTIDEWAKWSRDCLKMERDFNTKAGLAAIDNLPQFMIEEPLEEIDIRWDFDRAEIETYWDDF